MKEFIVSDKDEGKRLDRCLKALVPGLSEGLIHKFLRLKRVKLRFKGARADERVHAGDSIRLYIEDEYFAPRAKPDALLSGFKPRISIVYEDAQLMLLDKRPGLITHPDESEKVNTLLTHARAYLYQKGEYDPENDFAPVMVNRIDRFTGGIVLCAKTREAMSALSDKIRAREIEKAYLCAIEGEMRPQSGLLDGYILKTPGKSRVRVLATSAPGAQRAQTCYRQLYAHGGRALIECVLITGRTHQIRAQFAGAGCPLVGDALYGARPDARESYQALYSYKVTFNFTSDAGAISYLNGKSFEVKRVPFVYRLFPEFTGEL